MIGEIVSPTGVKCMQTYLQGIVSVGIVTILVGCDMSRPSALVADYGTYSFTEKRDDGYQYFGARFLGNNGKTPQFDVMLDDGRVFNCGALTIDSAKTLFSEAEPFESSTLDDKTAWIQFREGPVTAYFRGGVLESIDVRRGGKIRHPGQKEFVAIPIEESEMMRVFGEPKEVRRVYGSNP